MVKNHLTDSQRQAIDYINTTADLSDRDFMNLIGVFTGIKPATMMYPTSDEVLAVYRQLAVDLGFSYQEVFSQFDKFRYY